MKEVPDMPARMGERNTETGGMKLSVVCFVFVAAAIITAAALFLADSKINTGYQRMEQASERYVSAQLAAMDLQAASDYLTDRMRCFAVTGELRYLNDYFEEVEATKRRDNALSNLEELLEENVGSAYDRLAEALKYSNELMQREFVVMKLVQTAMGYDDSQVPEAVSSVALTPEELGLTAGDQMQRAQKYAFDDEYMAYKEHIHENVQACTQELILSSGNKLDQTMQNMKHFLNMQTVLTIMLLLVVVLFGSFVIIQVRRPLTRMVTRIKQQESVPVSGAAELRFVTQTYNEILEENLRARIKLTHEATHDALTGLYNRNAYEMLMDSVDQEHIALLIIDVDKFKTVNDTYGHDVGDKVLQRVANVLKEHFRSVDLICRFGGDEFVVIMTRSNSSMRKLIEDKIREINRVLQHPEDGLPPTSLSVGAAFADKKLPDGDLFKDADTALYTIKQSGRKGCGFAR